MHMQQGQYYLYREGVVDDEIWETNLRDLAGFYKFPGVKQWWDAGGKTGFTKEFAEVVEGSSAFAIMMAWDKEKGFYATEFHEKP